MTVNTNTTCPEFYYKSPDVMNGSVYKIAVTPSINVNYLNGEYWTSFLSEWIWNLNDIGFVKSTNYHGTTYALEILTLLPPAEVEDFQGAVIWI